MGVDAEQERLGKALRAIQTLRGRVEELERARSEPIAVVGMACRFPGSRDVDAFWSLLKGGIDATSEAPKSRWDLDRYYDPDKDAPGKIYTRRGGFIDDIDMFDAAFFGISPREAQRLDPQQRLLLETSWDALENAAINPRSLMGSETGVFIGMSEGEYLRLNHSGGDSAVDMYDLTGVASSVATGRLSYVLGLQGPSLAIDTACSSSLVAMHLAVNSLRRGECRIALAGGVNALLTPDVSIAFCRAKALAADGRCKTFDASADGYGRGEGAGMIVLKRLADALADNDPIQAVVLGSAVNQDGRTNGLTAPNGLAQQSVIKRALADARVRPEQVAFVETHGTGTSLGDPIEVQALAAVYGDRETPLTLGAVKTNIGHLEAAAGAAGVIKAILALQHAVIPPNLHLTTPNPLIDWAELPLSLPSSALEFPGPDRMAAVSSFGFSGTNAHLVLGEAPPRDAIAPVAERQRHVMTLSATTPTALTDLAGRYAAHLASHPDATFADLAHTANTGRAQHRHRLAVVAADPVEARTRLMDHLANKPAAGISAGEAGSRPRIAFLFTGQGSQYLGMGRQLFESQPRFREILERADGLLRSEGLDEPSLLDVIYAQPGSPAAQKIDCTSYAQPAVFALEYALCELWRSWGVAPSIVLGHSTGEMAAACVAGVFSFEAGLRLVAQRARLIEGASGRGATAAVFAAADVVKGLIGPWTGRLDVAGVNGPREVLVSGEAEAVDELLSTLKAQGLDGRKLKIPHAPHSPLMESVLAEFESFASTVRFAVPHIPLISNVTGALADHLDAIYWRDQLRAPVQFAEAMKALAQQSVDIILEIGPQPVLQLLGRQNWQGPPVQWLSSLWAIRDEWSQILLSLGDLYVGGAEIDWRAFDAPFSRRRVAAPTYPYQRQSYWLRDKDPPRMNASAADHIAAKVAFDGAATIRSDLRSRVAMQLDCAPDDLRPGATFVELGADSLLLAKLAQDILDTYGLQIAIGDLFEVLDTFETLAQHISEQPQAPTGRAPPPSIARSEPAPTVARGSRAEAPAVATLLDRQLEVMREQIELLRTLGAASESKSAAPPPAVNVKTVAPVTPVVTAVPPRTLTALQQAYVNDLIERFTRRTAQSRERARKFRSIRADTRMRLVRSETRAMAYPIVSARAQGAHFWDIDGNRYVDLAMGVGVLLCGHLPEFVASEIQEQIAKGIQTGPISDLADEVAEQICRMTGVERLFFAVTGTCAVRGALRLAQAATGRSRFAMFAGSYHGQDDRTLGNPDIQGDASQTVPSTIGISPAAVSDALILPYNSDAALETIRAHANELACVIVEPVQSRNPHIQPREFLHDLRRLTRELDIPLVFDEVITGFRIHPGGAQAWFGVDADLVVYGKCIGGGLPMSIVAGKSRFLDFVDSGDWVMAPEERPRGQNTYIGSTFEMHPFALAATRAMLTHMEAEGGRLQANLNARTAELSTRLMTTFEAAEVPISVLSFGSLFRFAYKGNASYAFQPLEMELFHLGLMERGIYTWEGRTCFLSTAHTDADLDAIVDAVSDVIEEIRRGGFFPPRGGVGQRVADSETFPLTDEQKLAWRFAQADGPRAPPWSVVEHLILRGKFDRGACVAAIHALVDRHPALRTVFAADGAEQRVLARARVPLEDLDFSDLTELSRETEVAAWLREAAARPFDLQSGPLFRAMIVRIAEDLHQVVLIFHHLIVDGWSVGLLLDDLSKVYNAAVTGRTPDLQEPRAFRHFAEGQQVALATREMHDAQEILRERLRDAPPPWPLGDIASTSRRGDRHSSKLEPALAAEIRRFAQDRNLTVFMLLLAAYGLLLKRTRRGDRFMVGCPQNGRSSAADRGVVGYCAHLMPVEIGPKADTTVVQFLVQTRENVLRAQATQGVPFANALALEGDLPALPLAGIFNLDRAMNAPHLEGLEVGFGPTASRYALVDLRLDAIELDGEIWLDWDYREDVLDGPAVAQLSDDFHQLLIDMIAEPDAELRHLVSDAVRVDRKSRGRRKVAK